MFNHERVMVIGVSSDLNTIVIHRFALEQEQ